MELRAFGKFQMAFPGVEMSHLSSLACTEEPRAAKKLPRAATRSPLNDSTPRPHQAVRVTPSTYSVMLAPVFAMSI